MTATVLQMAVLAAARIEQRAEPVRGVGGGRCRDPQLAEYGVADLEVELALEVHVARRKREGVCRAGRAARGGAAAGPVFARFGLGEVSGGLKQAFDRVVRVLAVSLDHAGKKRQSCAKEHSAEQERAPRVSQHCLPQRLCYAITEPGMGYVHSSFFRSPWWCEPPQLLRPSGRRRCRPAGRCIGSRAAAASPA